MFPRLAHKLRRARMHYREAGLLNTIEIACAYGYVPPWLYFRQGTHLLRLRSRAHVMKFGPRPDYRYFIAGRTHVDELASLDNGEDFRFMRRLFLDFLSHDALCYAIAKHDRIVAYNWLFRHQYVVTNDGYGPRQLRLMLGEHHAMFGNGYIVPEYRLKGLFPSLLWMAVNDRPADTVFLTTIARMNTDSLRAHERIGFEKLGTILCRRVISTACRWSMESPSRNQAIGRGQPAVALDSLIVPDWAREGGDDQPGDVVPDDRRSSATHGGKK
ncbi:MAG: hypothetical protein AB7U81_05155 [Thiohalomonadaceae bacterium]